MVITPLLMDENIAQSSPLVDISVPLFTYIDCHIDAERPQVAAPQKYYVFRFI